jgi:hypothetical protein
MMLILAKSKRSPKKLSHKRIRQCLIAIKRGKRIKVAYFKRAPIKSAPAHLIDWFRCTRESKTNPIIKAIGGETLEMRMARAVIGERTMSKAMIPS